MLRYFILFIKDMSKTVKDLLPHILDTQDNWRLQLLSNWQEIWGSLSHKVHLEKIEKTFLIIGVHDSCWLQELHMLSQVLLKTINKALGSDHIKQLRFKKIPLKKKIQPKKQTHSQSAKKRISCTLNVKEQQALDHIKDPQLSCALKQFLIRCHSDQ